MWCGHIQGGMLGQGTYTEAGKPLGKRPLEKPRKRWKDIIKMDVMEIECEDGR